MSGASLQTILPDGWPRPKGYANGVLAPAGARILEIAGMVGWDSAERMISDRLAEQFGQALENVCAVLTAAGGRPDQLTRLTFYVVDREEYRAARKEIGQQYRRVIGSHFPACTLVEVSALLEEGAKVEIEATAALSG